MEDFNILNNEASVVGPRLLGCVLEMKQGSQILSGKIVETEAYDQNDVASHWRSRASVCLFYLWYALLLQYSGWRGGQGSGGPHKGSGAY
jgi:hypothetical protein